MTQQALLPQLPVTRLWQLSANSPTKTVTSITSQGQIRTCACWFSVEFLRKSDLKYLVEYLSVIHQKHESLLQYDLACNSSQGSDMTRPARE